MPGAFDPPQAVTSIVTNVTNVAIASAPTPRRRVRSLDAAMVSRAAIGHAGVLDADAAAVAMVSVTSAPEEPGVTVDGVNVQESGEGSAPHENDTG